jgi:hypothetical protein
MGLADSLGALGFVAEDTDQICTTISGNLANDPIEGLDAAEIRNVVVDAIGVPTAALATA